MKNVAVEKVWKLCGLFRRVDKLETERKVEFWSDADIHFWLVVLNNKTRKRFLLKMQQHDFFSSEIQV